MNPRKIFLDVGAHVGETTLAAIKFDFDVIHCFEPASLTREKLKSAISDPRVRIHPLALSDHDGEEKLYHGKNSVSSSLFGDKVNVKESDFEIVQVRRASSWISENILPGDEVIGKINVEGAELAILSDLETAGVLGIFRQLTVYPDSRKVPSLAERGKTEMRRFTSTFPNVVYSFHALDRDLPTIEARTFKWLSGMMLPARAASAQSG